MIINTRDIKTEGDIGGRKIAMSLDQNSLVHLMGVLSDLYSDPVAAVIREYSTNAMDSHIKAGNPDPVKIVRPNRMNPFFKVIDQGVGMSEIEIESIFSKYGSSTKRNSNDEVGMLGLGSKSAFTYTQQFTFISTKDGVTVQAIISRDETGAGSIEIVNAEVTDAPNGVTVVIPVKDTIEFNKKIDDFVKYLPNDSVEIDGKLNKSSLEFISENVAVDLNDENQSYYRWRDQDMSVVMGGVNYPISHDHLSLGNRVPVTFFVEIGEIDFTPNREQLHYTNRTKETLEKLNDRYHDAILNYTQEIISESKTIREAFMAQTKVESLVGVNSRFNWGGTTLPETHRRAELYRIWPDGKLTSREISLTDIAKDSPNLKLVFIEDWHNKTISRIQGEKIVLSLDIDFDNKPVYLVLGGKKADYSWLMTPDYSGSWFEIKKTKIQSSGSSGTTVRRKERLWVGHETLSSRETDFAPDRSKPILHIPKSEWNYVTSSEYLPDDTQVVFVAPSERELFLRRYPKARANHDFEFEFLKDYLENPTEEDKEFLKIGVSRYSFPGELATKLKDKKLAVRVSEASFGDAESRYRTAHRAHIRLRGSSKHQDFFKDNPFPSLPDGDSYVKDNYELLDSLYVWRADTDHVAIYCNAVYDQIINKEKED